MIGLRTIAPWFMLSLAIAAVYLPVAGTPFVFDDQYSVLENPSLQTLWPLSVPLSPPMYFPTAGRPLVNLSLADALRHWPKYPEAHNSLGSVLVRTGQLDSAIVHFERAVDLAPDYPEARYNLEQARRARGR